MRTAAVLLFALSAADPATSEDKPSRPDAPARLVVQTRLPGATEGAEFVMAGKAVLMWSVGNALVADRETGRTLRTFPVGSVRVAHGRNLAVGSPALGTALKMPVLRPYLFDAAADADPKPVGPDDFRCIAYELTTDGKWLVTYQTDQQAASKRPTLAVWDAHTGKPVRSFDAVALAWEGGHRPLVALRGGHLVAAGHYDKTIRLWDVTAGKEVKRIDAGELSGNLAAAADGQAVAAATADGGTVWGCDGKLHGKLPLKNARGVVLSDDGKRVCVWRNDLVAGWVVAKAKPLFHEADWHARPVGWDADGKLQAVRFAGGLARTSPLPGPPAGEAPKDMPDVKRVDTAGLAGPDLLYTVSNVNVVAPTRVRFWDLANGARSANLQAYRVGEATGPATPTVIDGGGLVLAGVRRGLDGTRGIDPAVWAANLKGPKGRFDATLAVPDLWGMAAARTTGVAAVADGKTVRVWDPRTDKVVCALDGAPAKPATMYVTDDGTRVVLGGGKGDPLAVWDAATGKRLHVLKGSESGTESRPFSSRLQGSRLLTATLHPDAKPGTPAFTLNTWDAAAGKHLWSHATNLSTRTVGMSADGQWLAYSGYDDGPPLRVVSTATGAERCKILKPKGAAVACTAFDAAGDLLVVGETEGPVHVFDAKTGASKTPVKTHVRPFAVRVVRCGNPERTVLVVAGTDGTTVLCDATTGKPIARIFGFADDSWAVIDPDGRYDCGGGRGAASGDHPMLHWVANNEVIELGQLKDRFYEPDLLSKAFGYNAEPVRPVGAGLDAVKPYPDLAVAPPAADGKLSVTVTNRGGGIGRVVVLVNGKELTADARGPKPDENAKEAVIGLDLKGDPRLRPGAKNRVEVVAYNADGSLASRGAVREFDVPGAAEKDPPTLWAVVCGVSKYRGTKLDLKYAAKDADDFAAALKLAGGRLFDKRTKIALLSSSGDAKNRPSRANLVKALDALKDAKPDDVVLVYLAGHGVSLGGPDGDFHYLTADAETAEFKDPAVRDAVTLSSRDLTNRLKVVPAGKQVLIFDTCASGRFVEKIAEHRAVPGSQVRALESLKDRTGTFVLAGCAADAVSYEANRYGQGILTYSLLLGMRGGALKDGDIVDVGGLFGFAADEVPKFARDLGGIQQPVVALPKGGQSFPIGRLTAADKALVPLQVVRPAFIRSSFHQDAAIKRDVLGLGAKLDDALKTAAGRGKAAPLTFIDAAELPDAYVVDGEYKADGDAVAVTANLLYGDKVLGSLEAAGSKSKLDELAKALADRAEALLKAAKP